MCRLHDISRQLLRFHSSKTKKMHNVLKTKSTQRNVLETKKRAMKQKLPVKTKNSHGKQKRNVVAAKTNAQQYRRKKTCWARLESLPNNIKCERLKLYSAIISTSRASRYHHIPSSPRAAPSYRSTLRIRYTLVRQPAIECRRPGMWQSEHKKNPAHRSQQKFPQV